MYNLWYFVAFYAVLLQKVLFFAIYAVFRKIGLLQFTRYCVEKILAKNSDRGEKMTNIRYDSDILLSVSYSVKFSWKICQIYLNIDHAGELQEA